VAEVDRARQSLKEAERQMKSLHADIVQLRDQRDHTRAELAHARGQLASALDFRAQLDEQRRRVPASAARRGTQTGRKKKAPASRKS
jgi:septal ring factor EnvC (AmiA/AmiB activator)